LAINKIKNNEEIKTIKNNDSDSNYFSYPNNKDVKDFLKIMQLV